ncbi:MarR family winged helix-turn-helix transcriptional regulator [Streptomyces purpurogeneiscleroticus]|uniref:MarR family winged helix-turn-helix transcriptional regulator n=1 Tax=Streptomyces purpurogeneiscleroticus TaxID=68259 RepID=UPI001CBD8F15|nr:MarR family winged helix-turn-helix transcriptional regulator [Streptomyces purpurogeneiscleroticus]MBZ4016918.1 MarR family transcriptional regulator [Streptomyces purpurogeneiscleroticus]
MAETPYVPTRIRALPSWLLGRAAARGHRLVADALAREGMRMMHHAVLSAVAELGPVSQADLGRSLSIDPKDMVMIVNDLVAEELVTRAPDPRDRRKNAVTISPAGTRTLRRTQKLGDAANAELTAALSPAERDQLIDLLTRIAVPGLDDRCS